MNWKKLICKIFGHIEEQSNYGFGGINSDSFVFICKRCDSWGIMK